MKIRIQGNSIRYRLTQNEVKTLADSGFLSESTCFGPGENQMFVYALQAKEGISGLEARFEDGKITLYIPANDARNWYQTVQVGFENKVEVTPGVSLGLLLEKDFACLDATHEDQSDKFPNPKAAC